MRAPKRHWRGVGSTKLDQAEATIGSTVAADSRTVAVWTLFGRATGFLRVAVLAAVLGPTFFANLFQTVLAVPYFVSELMAGSLISALLAPPLVQLFDKGDRQAANKLAGGFLGVLLIGLATVALVGMFTAPLILQAITLAVSDPAVRARQIAVGLPLLLILLPQIALEGVIGVGAAVQQAHRRFALPTAAPAIENVGLVAVLIANVAIFGVGIDLETVTTPQLLLLGGGATFAAALHAIVQWAGAYRLGTTLVPIAGWRDRRVRAIVRRAIPSGGSAALNSVGSLALLVASGSIPGGAIAFQIAQNLYNLPIALFARPIATAQLPLLSRDYARSDSQSFQGTYASSLRLSLFVLLPVCLIFVGIPQTIAAAVSFGRMSDPGAVSLVAAVLGGLGFGILGEAFFVVSMSATYARLDATSPLIAMAVRVAVCLVGIALTLAIGRGPDALWYLGITYALAAICGGAYLRLSLRHVLPLTSPLKAHWVQANALIAVLAVTPAIAVARLSASDFLPGRVASAAALVGACAAIYFVIQAIRHSRELAALTGLAGWRGARGES